MNHLATSMDVKKAPQPDVLKIINANATKEVERNGSHLLIEYRIQQQVLQLEDKLLRDAQKKIC